MTDQDPRGAVQAVASPLTANAVFLVVDVAPGAADRVRDVLADLAGSIKSLAFPYSDSALTCTVGIGSAIWAELTALPRPAQLRPFTPVVGAHHTAPSTPGDLLFHIRAERADVCFEFEHRLLESLGDAVRVVDVHLFWDFQIVGIRLYISYNHFNFCVISWNVSSFTRFYLTSSLC